ncbi:MAG: hypothetical protein P8M25_18935 [Paracoccaceae bacterium]|nr:hypothetical protein [Paracoccaceae bacterium]
MRSLQRSFQVSDAGQTGKLLRFVVYQESAAEGAVQQFFISQNPGVNTLNLVVNPAEPRAIEVAGLIHHIAFLVSTDADQ